ncbi:hypothetical protein [Alteribacillus bidgolensis]|uniref:Uncharacterized protein n=1 Tax=Alteribacillus bidgolensis TaxID=930129 RepID=A0A1G8RBT5_9BACI|nr:hypothetical protein [Alteribacillus bidgolensis]SDJ14447.1 hypothetical protein SAMN05216352_12615 [Alteribacillus bidgolensis]
MKKLLVATLLITLTLFQTSGVSAKGIDVNELQDVFEEAAKKSMEIAKQKREKSLQLESGRLSVR